MNDAAVMGWGLVVFSAIVQICVVTVIVGLIEFIRKGTKWKN